MSLPTGTVTFLFTDVVAGTSALARLGDELWADLLIRHRDILRATFGEHGGVEVGTEGDAFLVAFERPTDALASAIDGQRALGAEPWPEGQALTVRMGIHTGEAVVRDGDYVGLEVNRAKRVQEAGHGQQILVSGTTRDLVAERMPETVTVTDLGSHHLKGIPTPERLCQVSAPDLRSDFPPPRTISASRGSLPISRSRFVGRDAEIEKVRTLLGEHDLVTLTGVGGCGKTRLAVQVATGTADSFPDGVAFIDLAPLATDADVALTFAETLGLGSGGRDLTDEVAHHLRTHRMLVVIDNCEHLLDATAELVESVLADVPTSTLLATSREALGVDGERAWRVPSLTTDGAADARRLFEERAGAASPGFEVTDANRPAVDEICRRLDGLPLAIEFAAARVSHLSPAEIAERLDDMFTLLSGGRRRVQRQQTLQAALDWRYDLLEEHEQRVLERMAVFSGPFDLRAAEDVCGEGLGAADVLSALGSLVQQSLVVADQGDDGSRYRLLETVRTYCLDKLRGRAELEGLRARHRAHFMGRGVPMITEGFDYRVDSYRETEQDFDNVRSAIDWSIERGEVGDAILLLERVAVLGFSAERALRFAPWRETFVAAASDPDIPLEGDLRVGVLTIMSMVAMIEASPDTLGLAIRALELAEGENSAGVVFAAGLASVNLSVMAALSGDPQTGEESRALAARGLDAARGHDGAVAMAHVWACRVELDLGDIPAALGHAEEALRLAMASGADLVIPGAASLTSFCRYLLGDPKGAVRLGDEILTGAADDVQGFRDELLVLPARVAVGHMPETLELLDQAIEFAEDRRVPLGTNHTLIVAGACALESGRIEEASVLLGAGAYAGIDDRAALPFSFRSPESFALYKASVDRIKAAMDRDALRRARDRGRSMSLDEAVRFAREVLGL